MAIWFYANAGYCKTGIPSSLSQITFLDETRPLVIPEGDIPQSDKGLFKYNGNNAQEAFEYVISYIGDDAYVISGGLNSNALASSVKISQFNLFLELMPGFKAVFPNLYTSAEELVKENNILFCIYIPTLKRVLISYSSTAFLVHIFVVKEDGSLIDSSTTIIPPFPFIVSEFSNNVSCNFFLLKKYTEGMDLGDSTNYSITYLNVRAGYDNLVPKYIVWIGNNGPSAAGFRLLFGEKDDEGNPVQPDGQGPVGPDNPYGPGGDSGEGGGNGTFDDSSDQINDSTLPTISSANTGFTRIYNPTLAQVQALAQYLWTDESVIQTIWNHIKQYFENPMEAMIGFNLVPVTVPDGGTTTFKLMYIDTGVSMTAAASQFVDTDCGTLKLDPYYGSALDYSPYTKVSIFLPYIGMVSVDTDEVMGRTLQIKYRTDICSGACVAKILVDGNVLYQYTGHCAINIPFSAADFSSYVSSVMSTAKLAGTLALGASGALGPVAVSEITQQTGEAITKTVNTERNPETGRQIRLSSQTQTRTPSEITTTKASYAGISPANVTNTVGEVISSKPHVEHSGSFSGTSGYLGVRRPYVIIKRPNMCMPANYQSLNGFPCMITLKLGDCKGFTRVQQVVLSNMGKATNPEQAEILGLLKNGVIL